MDTDEALTIDQGYFTTQPLTIAEGAGAPFAAPGGLSDLEKSFLVARAAQYAEFVPKPHDSRQVRRRYALLRRRRMRANPVQNGNPQCRHRYELVGERRSYDRKPLGLLRCTDCQHRRVMNLREWTRYLAQFTPAQAA